jgi:hypothetical protein
MMVFVVNRFDFCWNNKSSYDIVFLDKIELQLIIS